MRSSSAHQDDIKERYLVFNGRNDYTVFLGIVVADTIHWSDLGHIPSCIEGVVVVQLPLKYIKVLNSNGKYVLLEWMLFCKFVCRGSKA